jgi:hypothetical protein
VDLYVHRVSYGKDKTPEEDREYRWGSSPVGNRKDWLNFAKEHGYDGVWFTEKDGKTSLRYDVNELLTTP